MATFMIKALVATALVCFVFDNATTAASAGGSDDTDGGGGVGEAPSSSSPSSLMDRVSGVMDSVKQQASETLDGAGAVTGNAASVLGRLQPGTTKPVAKPVAKLPSGDNALGRLQETKGRTVAAAKKVVDETIHKVKSTVDDIRRTVSGDDRDDVGGDRRISNALDNLLRAVGSEGKAVFEYTSDIINETADRAKAAVEKSQQNKLQRRTNQNQ